MQLTHLGEQVYFKGRYILEQMEQLEYFHQQEVLSNQEKINIGVPITLVDDLSEYIYERYKHDHYLTGVEIQSGWGRSLIQRVAESELPLAIVMIPSNLNLASHLSFLDIGTLPLVVVSVRSGVKEHTSLERCSKKGWVIHPEGCCFRECLNKELKERNLFLYANKEIFGIEPQLHSILNGDGLGIFPKPFIDQHSVFNHADLEIVAVEDFNVSVNVGIIYADQRHLNEVNYFAKIVKERYF